MSAIGKSPAEQRALMDRARNAEAERAEERRQLGRSLANVLGVDDKRTADQGRVWDYLTAEVFHVSRVTDTNALLIFEGARRKAAEIAVLVEEATKLP